jgi:hypothetical protein
MNIRNKSLKPDVEKQILISMIVSTEYLLRNRRKIQIEYFQLDYVRKIVPWVLEYFDKYRLAPVNHIEDIYTVESSHLKEEEKELISLFLQGLSEKYEEGNVFNVQFYEDLSDSYFDERLIILRAEKTLALANAGKIEEAKRVISDYKGVEKDLIGWQNLADEQFISDVYRNTLSPEIEDSVDTLFRLPGALGELVGPIKRDWLISILGPRKRGKSFLIGEMGIQAAMNRLKVVLISLEMNKLGIGKRILQGIVGEGPKREYTYTVFDCVSNQDGSCNRSERKNQITLMRDGAIPLFEVSNPYKPCIACRGTRNGSYRCAYWREVLKRPVSSENRFLKHVNGFFKMHGENFVLKPYPANSASITDITRDLDMLEEISGFVPDVLILDYADIIGPEDKRADKLEQINQTWMAMKGLAEEKHCAVITATQGNRASGDTKDVKSNQVAGFIAKNDHVDAMYAISQQIVEKRMGIIRVSNPLHRWQECDEEKQVYVLQNLELSQVLLDSEWVQRS